MTGTTDHQIEAATQLARVEHASRRQLREALLEVGGHLGWDHHTVVCISETITGRPWQRCGGDDVVRVARVLLEIATALRSGIGPYAVLHGEVAVDRDAPGVVTPRGV
jgi:hypothetical protein